MAHIRKTAPMRSISKIFCLIVKPEDFRFGGVKKNATARIAMAPNGKLI